MTWTGGRVIFAESRVELCHKRFKYESSEIIKIFFDSIHSLAMTLVELFRNWAKKTLEAFWGLQASVNGKSNNIRQDCHCLLCFLHKSTAYLNDTSQNAVCRFECFYKKRDSSVVIASLVQSMSRLTKIQNSSHWLVSGNYWQSLCKTKHLICHQIKTYLIVYLASQDVCASHSPHSSCS